MGKLFDYEVTRDTYQNKNHVEWNRRFTAENAAAARKQFDQFWYEHENKTDLFWRKPRHPFHIKVKRIKPEKTEESREG